ncbi:hypothetical protein [Paenibacillus alkalitolerans]|uniref:hypothetical protein n=1 Tax=Paenibacillus alkalitolerans TaxID=2799335 RepID=UPI0018F54672|nr:hypothetical protein [Paenibacillus alkalitolerans]
MAKFSILQTFYASAVWRNLRMTLILEREGRCERCFTISKPEDIVGHHKIELTPENVHDHTISLNPEKIEIICRRCHDEEHDRFGKRKAKTVYLVYGPPLAGKKTFVRQQMRRGDLIVSMDLLYAAMSGLPEFDKPDNLFQNVIGLHNQLIDNVKTRMGKWSNAWIVGGYADKFKRERTADELGAELVFINASREECYSRLAVDERLQYRQVEWRGYIDKWFEQYRE